MLPRKLFFNVSRLASLGVPRTHTVPRRTNMTLWEPDKRSGYRSFIEDENWYDRYKPSQVKAALKWYRKEFGKFWQEIREYSYGDPTEYLQHADCKIVHDLRDPEQYEDWVVTADSDYDQGKSRGEFKVTPYQTGIFSGTLYQEPIKDGHTKAAGYVNIRAPLKFKSFSREDRFDWLNYTHFVIKIRGDGRTYMLNLNVRGDFDILWADTYNYPLHTRGGPYWQTERIPFSKFILSHKGRIQDKQEPINLQKVHNISITCSDDIDGPFQLEIDYVAVEFDQFFTEEFAYELYESRKYET